MQLDASWRTPRDPKTGALLAEGKLWDFTEKIAKSRREGKNRRDGATVSSRVLRLTDELGRKLWEETVEGERSGKGKAPSRLNNEEKEAFGKSIRQVKKKREERARAHL